jgi:hypothetical protein
MSDINTTPSGVKSSTLIVCGTLVLLACIAGVFYVLANGGDVSVALSFVGPIVLAVLGGVYNATKLDQVESKVAQVVVQTNGGLDKRIRDGVHAALDERGIGSQPAASNDSEES